jgi:hypothetical protein
MFFILDSVENFTDWERFQSLASALVSPRVEINSGIETDEAARDYAASIASAYRLSNKTITNLDRNRGPLSLERLLKHKQRLRKLWKETRDPACRTAVSWVTKTIRRKARMRTLVRGETKIENCEVTPQAIWPICEIPYKEAWTKGTNCNSWSFRPRISSKRKNHCNCKLHRKHIHAAQSVWH